MSRPVFPARVNVSEHVLFQEIEKECVLLDMASEQYYGLDDVGTRIWQLLAEDGDPARTVIELQKVYDVDEETLREDVAKLIYELRDKGLINVVL